MVELQYRLTQQHDLSASFIEPVPRRALHELAALPGVDAVEGLRSVPVRLRHDSRHQQVSLTGLPADSRLRHALNERLQSTALAPDGLVLNEHLAKRLGVGVGDRVWVEVLEGRRKLLLLPVTQLVREYVGMQAYMQLQALNRALGDGDVVNIALMTLDESMEANVLEALDRRPAVMGAESRHSAVRALYRSIGEMTSTFTWISLLMGATINFGVVYNAARIALAERGRELASLRVLGMTQGEVSYILLGELGLLVVLSIPLSFAAGYGLSWYMAHQLQSDLYRVPVHIPDSAYAFAALVTVASAVLSGLAVRWRVRQLDLIAVLKTRE
jgi:putative ABC transport system permease protein